MKQLCILAVLTVFVALVGVASSSKNGAQAESPLPGMSDAGKTGSDKDAFAVRKRIAAIEQAHEFCREKGIDIGFDEKRRVVTQIAESTFEYQKTMDDETFAIERYRAVQRAFLNAAIGIYWCGARFSDASDGLPISREKKQSLRQALERIESDSSLVLAASELHQLRRILHQLHEILEQIGAIHVSNESLIAHELQCIHRALKQVESDIPKVSDVSTREQLWHLHNALKQIVSDESPFSFKKLRHLKHDLECIIEFGLGVYDDEDTDSQLGRVVDRKFSWAFNSMASSLPRHMKLDPLLGVSIVQQFESRTDERYEVALIVSCEEKKGADDFKAFREGELRNPGRMSLQEWVNAQDFSLVAGPRQYVDNEGTQWAIGIVPAAEGQKPYGNLLDAAARNAAALTFGCGLEVSPGGRNSTTDTMNDDSSGGDASIELKGWIESWYPRELELYFHRPYTNKLTGRKGVVSICALRGGASKIIRQITLQKIEAQTMAEYQKGRLAGIHDALKLSVKELDDIKSADEETRSMILSALRELHNLDEEMQWFQRKRNLRSDHVDAVLSRALKINKRIDRIKVRALNANKANADQ